MLVWLKPIKAFHEELKYKKGKTMFDGEFGKLFESTRKVSERLGYDIEADSEDLAGKFGLFGYSKEDENTWTSYYDTDEEAKAAALELGKGLNGKDLDYIEVWQADEEGRFGVSGEPIYRKEYSREENTNAY